MNEIQIQHRKIGREHSPFVIAGIGINHEGSYEKAIQLVNAAYEAHADCVTFQCHITKAERIQVNSKTRTVSKERLWDIIKRSELSEHDEIKIKEYCERKGILYLSAPFSKEAAERLHKMRVPAFKISSGDCNNLPLIEHIAKWGKPIILSTGMNDMASIIKSVSLIRKYGCPLLVMHCTSCYPTSHEKVRLDTISELEKKLKVPVGLSDHSNGIYTCLGAVALGACALEKHFTISRSWPGLNHFFSIEPMELTEMVKGSRAVFSARGGGKIIFPEEQIVKEMASSSVVTILPVKKGEEFTLKNIWVKRPGTGQIPASDLKKVLGKKAKKKLAMNVYINERDIA
ncbi:MAG: N-acetylneuraminate synthase family protein [Candidatus Aureabacteria bacterium]|nr:N-acetylneuraminate synthase family protein [Candidatus Auribacterota bacterium]